MKPVHIYKTLKEQIIELILPPESVINLSDLAKTFGVSRTPLKEILNRLQGEGWVINQGGHFVVPSLSLERLIEFTEIRIILEIQAHIWAIDRITRTELLSLETVKRKILEASNATDYEQSYKLDHEFHRILYKAAKNSQLALILDRLLMQHHRFWLSIPREGEPKAPISTILAIIEAIAEKDEELIKKETRAHIQWSVDTVKNYL
jgi:DNA-binding GntR family transcriptional regulator